MGGGFLPFSVSDVESVVPQSFFRKRCSRCQEGRLKKWIVSAAVYQSVARRMLSSLDHSDVLKGKH